MWNTHRLQWQVLQPQRVEENLETWLVQQLLLSQIILDIQTPIRLIGFFDHLLPNQVIELIFRPVIWFKFWLIHKHFMNWCFISMYTKIKWDEVHKQKRVGCKSKSWSKFTLVWDCNILFFLTVVFQNFQCWFNRWLFHHHVPIPPHLPHHWNPFAGHSVNCGFFVQSHQPKFLFSISHWNAM